MAAYSSKGIGENIKRYRKAKHMKQQDLADKINKSVSSVKKYEIGLVQIPNNVLEEIATALDVSFIDLLADTPGREFIVNKLRGMGLTEAQIANKLGLPVPENTSLNTSPEIAFRIQSALDHLNDEGQERVADYAEDLLLIPKYQK